MKRSISSLVTLLTMVTALLLGSTATASATRPDDVVCFQETSSLVICLIDFDIILPEDPDIVVEIEVIDPPSQNELVVLENAINDADILNGMTVDVNLLRATVADVLDIDAIRIQVYICAIQSHRYCN